VIARRRVGIHRKDRHSNLGRHYFKELIFFANTIIVKLAKQVRVLKLIFPMGTNRFADNNNLSVFQGRTLQEIPKSDSVERMSAKNAKEKVEMPYEP
jgi:hypothetical protein